MQIQNIPAFNRTSLELKRGSGIPAGNADFQPFNRTSLELKPFCVSRRHAKMSMPFNRTSLELKPAPKHYFNVPAGF